MPAEDMTFRNAMRLLAGGVTIIATACEDQRSGLTATAVCSLALDPPRVLASVNMQGLTYGLVSKSRIMSVNMLSCDHAALAERFARKREESGEDRFAGADWRECVTGAPVLADALAGLDCRVTDIVPIGTHAILIGTVEDILFGPRRAPLLNFEGAFTTIATESTT